MSMSDPIADLLTRIRNALHASHDEVELPSSRLKVGIAKVLKSEGFIEDFHVTEDDKQGVLNIRLKYKANKSVIAGIKRVSKPSCRVYVGAQQDSRGDERAGHQRAVNPPRRYQQPDRPREKGGRRGYLLGVVREELE